jgi:hypothetical protein
MLVQPSPSNVRSGSATDTLPGEAFTTSALHFYGYTTCLHRSQSEIQEIPLRATGLIHVKAAGGKSELASAKVARTRMSSSKTQIVRVYEAWPLKKGPWSCPDRGELPLAAAAVAKSARPAHPFAVPARLNTGLDELRTHWNSLKRGSAVIPFADDLKLGELGLSDRILVIEAFESPERFRFNIVGEQIAHRYGRELAGKFADEIAPRAPLDYFLSQCAATVEAHAPTFYRHAPEKPDESKYERIIFPLWIDGYIGALLGAVHESEKDRT